jgi:hypothetical protein
MARMYSRTHRRPRHFRSTISLDRCDCVVLSWSCVTVRHTLTHALRSQTVSSLDDLERLFASSARPLTVRDIALGKWGRERLFVSVVMVTCAHTYRTHRTSYAHSRWQGDRRWRCRQRGHRRRCGYSTRRCVCHVVLGCSQLCHALNAHASLSWHECARTLSNSSTRFVHIIDVINHGTVFQCEHVRPVRVAFG